VRDGIVIGVLLDHLDHHGEIMIFSPADLAIDGLRPSLLPSSIQLLRCAAEAAPRSARRRLAPAVRWSVGSLGERTDQGETGGPDTGRRLEDQPANRRLRGVWDPVVVPGLRPGLFDCCVVEVRDQRKFLRLARWWRRGDSNS
jgi:hypothetical protein